MPPPSVKPDFLNENEFLTAKQIAKRLSVNVDTVRRLIRLGEFEHKLYWHTYYVSRKDVEEFEKKRRKLLTGSGEDQSVRSSLR